MGSEVADHQAQRADLALDVDIPRLHAPAGSWDR
jgi:hypothetical protein